jgi:hypothetical protein
LNFCKKNIFVLTGMFARSRAASVALVANHRPAIRNTRIAIDTSRAIGLRGKEDAKMAMRRQLATPHALFVRDRAWISGDR